MAHKRQKYKNTTIFNCPHCQQRLWRTGGRKHKIYYQNSSEIKENHQKIIEQHWNIIGKLCKINRTS